jgi:hypothetical protein
VENVADAVDDGHQAVADGAEDRLDLWEERLSVRDKKNDESRKRRQRALTHDTTAPMIEVLWRNVCVCSLCVVLWNEHCDRDERSASVVR